MKGPKPGAVDQEGTAGATQVMTNKKDKVPTMRSLNTFLTSSPFLPSLLGRINRDGFIIFDRETCKWIEKYMMESDF